MRTKAWTWALMLAGIAAPMALAAQSPPERAADAPAATQETPAQNPPSSDESAPPAPTCAGNWGETVPALGPLRPVLDIDPPGGKSLLVLRRGSWFVQDDWSGQIALERDSSGDRWRLSRFIGQQVYSGRPAPDYDDGCAADGDWRTVAETWTFAIGQCPAADSRRATLAQAVHQFGNRLADTLAGKKVESATLFDGSSGLGVRYELRTVVGPALTFFETQGDELTAQSEQLFKAMRACSKSAKMTLAYLPSSPARPKRAAQTASP